MITSGPVLFPTDFSTCSIHALTTASDFARRLSVPLLIIHVVETLGPENVTFGEAGTALQPQGYRQRLQTDLQEIRPTDTDVPVERLIAEGDPARQIVALAEERGCGLIVMGTYGHTGLMRLLMMGSTTGYVVRHATCPVLTVKLPTTR